MTIDERTTAMARVPGLYPPTVVAPDEPLPMWRLLPTFVRNPLRTVPRQVYEDDMVVISPRKGILVAWVAAPALVEKVLVTDADKVGKSAVERRVFRKSLAGSVLVSDGADWRWQRRALAPLFRPVDLLRHVPKMTAAAEAQVERWRTSPRGLPQAVDDDMLRTTYDVILSTMLVGGRPAEAEAILAASNQTLKRISWEIAYGVLQFPTWLPHPASWQIARAARLLRRSVGAIIARRRDAADATSDDLLARLLGARHPDTGEPMPDDLVISNLLTLLEAGHETTAKALTWTLYLLARDPVWQSRVRAEVEAIAGDRPVAAEDIDRLVVTQQVIKEAMRLYPPAPVMARDPLVPIEVGGVTVAPGSQIIIPVFAIHRHRRLWDDPDRFDPARFAPEAEAAYGRTQYMPFGAGARVCIGATFAMIEATALLATFVRAARFDWDGRHLPEPVSRITLRPDGGMPLLVSPV